MCFSPVFVCGLTTLFCSADMPDSVLDYLNDLEGETPWRRPFCGRVKTRDSLLSWFWCHHLQLFTGKEKNASVSPVHALELFMRRMCVVLDAISSPTCLPYWVSLPTVICTKDHSIADLSRTCRGCLVWMGTEQFLGQPTEITLSSFS